MGFVRTLQFNTNFPLVTRVRRHTSHLTRTTKVTVVFRITEKESVLFSSFNVVLNRINKFNFSLLFHNSVLF